VISYIREKGSVIIILLLYYLLSFLAYTGFYLFYEGKPYGEKPPSATGYDYIRAFTYFYVNSQRIYISKALAKTRGGDSLPIERLRLLLPARRYEYFLVVPSSYFLV
jgi:hypothetical protein